MEAICHIGPQIVHPSISKNVLDEITRTDILKKLMPERRFDQTLYISSLTIK